MNRPDATTRNSLRAFGNLVARPLPRELRFSLDPWIRPANQWLETLADPSLPSLESLAYSSVHLKSPPLCLWLLLESTQTSGFSDHLPTQNR
jgi:hypothetical protein